MPVTISCPRCARNLKLSSRHLGREVQCYGCQLTFTATAPAAAPAAPAGGFDFGALSTLPKVSADPAEFLPDPAPWGVVRLGIWLVLSALTVGALTIVVSRGAIAVFANTLPTQLGTQEMAEARKTAQGVEVLVVFSSLIGGALTLVLWSLGNMCCLAAPGKHRARLFAFISFLLGLAVLALTYGPLVLYLAAGRQIFSAETDKLISRISQVVQLGELVFFLFFLRALAKCIRDPGMGRSAIILLVLGGVVLTLTLGIAMLTGNLGIPRIITSESLQQTLQIIFFVDLFLIAGFVLWYLLALFSLQERLAYASRRQRKDLD